MDISLGHGEPGEDFTQEDEEIRVVLYLESSPRLQGREQSSVGRTMRHAGWRRLPQKDRLE